MFGVILVGTYASVFIAAPILIYLGVGTGRDSLTGRSTASDANPDGVPERFADTSREKPPEKKPEKKPEKRKGRR